MCPGERCFLSTEKLVVSSGMEQFAPEHASMDVAPARQGRSHEELNELLAAHPETRELIEVYDTVVKLAAVVAEHGGRVYVVGGAVRDELLGGVPRDFDLEVHGLSQEQLETITVEFGASKPSGKDYGTYKLKSVQGKIEVALARRDYQTGARHTDVDVDVIPDLGIVEAARRREFTIGAIYKDVLNGQIFDPHHGIDDLEHRLLRMVDPRTFPDDALRVLRGARQVARFGLSVEPETERAMATMVERIGALPKERLREEWLRLLTEAPRPSVGFELERQIGVIDRWHPELAKLWSTEQDPVHHPEGNVGVHTMFVVDETAAVMRELGLAREHRQALMLAALTHDLGKPATLQRRTDVSGTVVRITNHSHEIAGVKPAEDFLASIGIPQAHIERITPLVANHMRPADLYRDRERVGDKALRKLAKDIGPSQLWSLVALAEADHRGRGPYPMSDGTTRKPDTSGYRAWWTEQIERLQLDQPPQPILWGRDLVEGRGERNWPPSRLVGEAVRLAQELALDGMSREEVLVVVDNAPDPETAIIELRSRLNAS